VQHSGMKEAASGPQPSLAPPLAASPIPSHNTGVEHEKDDVPDSPDTETSSEPLTIRIPGRYHSRAPQLQQQPGPISPQDDSEEPPITLPGDKDDDAPQHGGRVRHFPARSTRSGLVRNAGGSGALLDFGAFEGLEPAFVPTPTTPDPQSTRETLRVPDANDWKAATDAEIDNIRRREVFKEDPRPNGRNITTPNGSFAANMRTAHSPSTRRDWWHADSLRYPVLIIAKLTLMP